MHKNIPSINNKREVKIKILISIFNFSRYDFVICSKVFKTVGYRKTQE